MDQDKKALPQKRRKVAVDVKDIKRADGQVPTDVDEGVCDPGVSESFFSLGNNFNGGRWERSGFGQGHMFEVHWWGRVSGTLTIFNVRCYNI